MRHETRRHAKRHSGQAMKVFGSMRAARAIGLAAAGLMLALLAAGPWSHADAAEAPGTPSIGGSLALETPAPTGRIIVKFTDDSALEVERGALTPVSADASRLQSLLSTHAGAFTLERHFSRDARVIDAERIEAQRNAGRTLPNLNRYARLVPGRDMTRAELLDIVKALRADPAVETAFLEPAAVPAALGFDAFTGTYTAPAAAPTAAPAAVPALAERSPDFTSQQGYLNPAPLGVNAIGAWITPGGAGQTVKVIDVEGAWLWAHEDIPDPFFEAGGQIDDLSWRNHGTAVMGEIRGGANGLGVTGIAYSVAVGGCSIAGLSVADAINTASANMSAGDIFLIELHAPGPNANGAGQYGYVCMEYWQDNFDAIEIACASGRICCEAAGNGEQNLDDPIYGGLFDRNVRDSGAIMCGASNGGALDPAWFTNYGARVDLHGWGYEVVSCGYGNLQGGDETVWYTNTFSGTSSASPIVLGSVASLQGMCKAAFGIPLNGKLARDILVATGTPQNGTAHIGPRPNITAAWALANDGIGRVQGVVRDAATSAPIADVLVKVQETGAFARTNASGDYQLPLMAGTWHLSFDSFFYLPLTQSATVSGGQTTTLNVAMTSRPLVSLGGTVLGDDGGTSLAGVRVKPLDAPLAATVSDANGDWSIAGFPAGRSYHLSFDHLPGYGADMAAIDVPAAARFDYALYVQLPAVTENFETGNGGFTASSDGLWAYGTPAAGTPPSVFSGTKCWGVGMSGPYADLVYGTLTSPAYDFSGETELYLSFHYWCDSESGFDGANVQVWNAATSTWDVLQPLIAYNSTQLGGIFYQNGWSGSTGDWVGTVFDLTGYISSEVTFRLQFGSDGGVTGNGFWIDDIAFDRGDASSDVPPAVPGLAAGEIGSFPNPAPATARIALTLPQAGEARVGVYDVGGRLVRTLHAGPLEAGTTELVWDGRDANGERTANGVYFVRMTAGGRVLTRTIVVGK
jgi:serine protease